MIYSKERGWYFVHVPKNAGTTISRMFSENEDVRNFCQIERTKHEIHHNKASFWQWSEFTNGLMPVAILRNPFDRCLSLYTYNLERASRNLDEEWGKWDHARLTREGFKGSWMDGGFFVDGHGIEFEYSEETGRAWSQSDDQFSWLEGVSGARWFRVEDQLDDFCRFTGLPKPQKKINQSIRGNYKFYFDQELREQIEILFKRDLDLGGYQF